MNWISGYDPVLKCAVQVLPADMSLWTIHCLVRDRRTVTFVRVAAEDSAETSRQEAHQPSRGCNAADPTETAITALIDAINNDSDPEFHSQPRPVTSTQTEAPRPPASAASKQPLPSPIRAAVRPPETRAGPSPATSTLARSASSSGQARPRYTPLAQCGGHKQRYNVMAVLAEVLETPRRRKSKIVARVMITDESLVITGDLREHFKFDILADSMEQMPDLKVGNIMRIHHMVVEVFNGKADGRVFSGGCVTTVAGGTDRAIVPQCAAARGGEREIVWAGEDDARVEQLRAMWAGQISEARRLEDIVAACVSRVTCRVVAVFTCPGQLILRLEDGTASAVSSLEFRGHDTESMEQVGDNKLWVDAWSEADRPASVAGLNAGDFVRLPRLRCAALAADSEAGQMFKFSFDCRALEFPEAGDAEVEEVKLRLGVTGNTDEGLGNSYVDRLLAAVNMSGPLTLPNSESLAAAKVTEDPPASAADAVEADRGKELNNPASPNRGTSMSNSSEAMDVVPTPPSKPVEKEIPATLSSSSDKDVAVVDSVNDPKTICQEESILLNNPLRSQEGPSRKRRSSSRRISLKRSRSITPPPTLKLNRNRNGDWEERSRSPSPKLKLNKSLLPSYSLRSRSSTSSSSEDEITLSHPLSALKPSSEKKKRKGLEDSAASNLSVDRSRSESPPSSNSKPLRYSLRQRSQTPPVKQQSGKRRRLRSPLLSAANIAAPRTHEAPPPAAAAAPQPSPGSSVASLPCAQPPPPSSSATDSPLPCSQMSEFLADASPLRTRPSPPPSEPGSPQLSRHSSLSVYASCRGSPAPDRTECTLLQDSEEIEVSQKNEAEDSQYSFHSESDFELTRMSMEINSSLFNPSDLNTNTTLANINPPSERNPDDPQEVEDNLESMSQPLLVQEVTDDEEENNKNSTVDENSENCTKIKAKEHHSENRLEDDNKASGSVDNVDHEKGEEDTIKSAPEKRTLGQYRAHLRTRCEAECGRWARVTCSLLPAAPPGTYRLLCVVRKRCESD